MIKELKHISPKTKILLLALILILLPSAILGYLGFKSIEGRGQRLKDNYQGLARLLRDRFEDDLLRFETSFLRDVTTRHWGGDFQTIGRQLGQIQERYLLISDIFLMEPEGPVIHPKVVLGTGSLMPPTEGGIQPGQEDLIDLGERYEFVERDYPTAIHYYQKATEQPSSDHLRSYAHALVARCYSKLKNYQKAERAYLNLLAKSENTRSPGGTPLKIIGLSQLSETYGLLGQDQDQRHTVIELYEELISIPWGFEGYEFYLQTVKAELDRISKTHVLETGDLVRLAELKEEETLQMERVRFLEMVRGALRSQVNSNLGNVPASESPGRYTGRGADGAPYQIGYVTLSFSDGVMQRPLLVYQIDKEFVLTTVLSDITEETEERDLGGNVQVGIFGEEESLVFPPDAPSPEKALSVENLTHFFPWWKLSLFDRDGKTVEAMVRREKQQYGAGLLGILALILVGITMTLRAATHEVELARLKSEFVSNVSHELKTPLALIRLFGETLESGQVKDAGQRKKFSRIIARESQRLSHLIDNVLDFSKIDAGRKEYTFQKTDLVKVVSSTLEAYRFHLRDQGFEFVASIPENPIFVQIDKDAISQAVLNLLANAEKYSREHKHIGVEILPRDSEVWVSIQDMGVGIPKESLKQIFDQFYRGEHDTAQEIHGSGLGLTIVKHIVEGHGGEIAVESEVGVGTRFTVKLPREREKEGA